MLALHLGSLGAARPCGPLLRMLAFVAGAWGLSGPPTPHPQVSGAIKVFGIEPNLFGAAGCVSGPLCARHCVRATLSSFVSSDDGSEPIVIGIPDVRVTLALNGTGETTSSATNARRHLRHSGVIAGSSYSDDGGMMMMTSYGQQRLLQGSIVPAPAPTTLPVVRLDFLITVTATHGAEASSKVQASLNDVVASPKSAVAAQLMHRLQYELRAAGVNATGGNDVRDYSAVKCSIPSNATLVHAKPLSERVNFIMSVTGLSVGPLVIVYGNNLLAFVTFLNSAWAAGLEAFIGYLSQIDHWSKLDTGLPDRLYLLAFATITITTASLKRGAIDMALRVGIITSQMQAVTLTLLEQFQQHIPAAALGSVSALLGGLIASVATALSAGKLMALTAFLLVGVINGVLAPRSALIAETIEHDELDCKPEDPRDTPPLCVAHKWLHYVVLNAPALIPVALALLQRKITQRKLARRKKQTPEARPQQRTSNLIKVNTAVMGSSLFVRAILASLAEIVPQGGRAVVGAVLLWTLAAFSIFIQIQLENLEVQGENAEPRCAKFMGCIMLLKRTLLVPFLRLNDAILRAAGMAPQPTSAEIATSPGMPTRSPMLDSSTVMKRAATAPGSVRSVTATAAATGGKRVKAVVLKNKDKADGGGSSGMVL